MRRFAALLFGGVLLVHTTSAAADDGANGSARPARAEAPYALENTSAFALGLEFLGSLVVLSTAAIVGGEPATSCGWCETNAFDRWVRRGLVMDESRTPGMLSHLFSLGVVPVIAVGGTVLPAFSHGNGSYAVQDTVILLNTFVITQGVTDGFKRGVARRRPAFVYGRERETEFEDSPGQEFLSFFSGDTAWAFAFATSGTTLAYLRGYSTAPFVAVNAGAFAVGAGLLRIMADVHWATDVLAGAATGTAIGFAVPYLFHRRDDGDVPRLAIAPSITREHAVLVAAGEF